MVTSSASARISGIPRPRTRPCLAGSGSRQQPWSLMVTVNVAAARSCHRLHVDRAHPTLLQVGELGRIGQGLVDREHDVAESDVVEVNVAA